GGSDVGIDDKAGFFSKEAIRKAAADIASIKKKHDGHGLTVETFPEPPDAPRDREARERYFRDLGLQKVRAHGGGGVFVFIWGTPGHHGGHFQVEVGNKTEQIFHKQDADKLRSILAEGLAAAAREKDRAKANAAYDDTLERVADYVDTAYQANAGDKK